MAAQTLAPAPEKVNGKVQTSAPSSGEVADPAAENGKSAPISEEEAAFLQTGEDAPSADGGEVQTEAESSGEGEEAAGEESTESEGDEPEGAESEVDLESDAVFKDALRLAKGDPKKALKIAGAILGIEDADDGKDEAAAGEASLAERMLAEVDADVAKFYEERGTEEKPGDERKALSKLLASREKLMVERVAQVLEEHEAKQNVRTRTKESEAELWKKHPDWVKDKAAFLRFVASDPALRHLSHLRAWRLFQSEKAERSSSATVKKDAAVQSAVERKAKGANANTGGRATGPTERKPLTTEQREMAALRQTPKRFTLP